MFIIQAYDFLSSLKFVQIFINTDPKLFVVYFALTYIQKIYYVHVINNIQSIELLNNQEGALYMVIFIFLLIVDSSSFIYIVKSQNRHFYVHFYVTIVLSVLLKYISLILIIISLLVAFKEKVTIRGYIWISPYLLVFKQIHLVSYILAYGAFSCIIHLCFGQSIVLYLILHSVNIETTVKLNCSRRCKSPKGKNKVD